MRREKGVEWLGLCRENGEGGWGSVVRREKGAELWGQTTGRVDCGTTQMGPLLGTPLHHPSSSRPSPCPFPWKPVCTSTGWSDSSMCRRTFSLASTPFPLKTSDPVFELLHRRRTLDGDACCPHEGGCPHQLLQVAIELVPQKRWFRPRVLPHSIMYWTMLQIFCSHVCIAWAHLRLADLEFVVHVCVKSIVSSSQPEQNNLLCPDQFVEVDWL